ncbi:hypothetical protein AB1A81_11580 [Bdellovibrio bacteriovorus]|uniref:Cytochrome c domain-containing protein n=1 Tax=Bdellovibrio bacteriovorus (strain ATCC 15356 / DSM 50701 / NCIMB 9529 / HD100) TaxID=264462 RepID=Q6MK81_BDEBA|nr:hypothetical protein [Bdellovibrio bacteriovorus]AHZ85034.1 hypothetical protein EP01_08795 [Bdellovibrio bacteriovorus]BEV68922.1 hypothetical protein Bb109J_c2342 [Bdellovibrio bacteriovorus]CAE80328.1 hypothetical protein predicted by Glimmer/Critica [Bdellovibrio bacteriovorus HD100]
MKKLQSLKVLGAVSGGLILVLAFQNCAQSLGEGFQIDTQTVKLVNQGSSDLVGGSDEGETEEGEQSTGDLCEDQLYAKFGSGYYVFLKNNCAGCHNGEHEAPAFASKNSLMSYQVFKDKGYTSISDNAVNPAHNPPYTGTHHNGAIASLKQEWAAAQSAFLSCKGDDGVDKSVVTANKTNATIVNSKANPATWTKIEWNYSTAADMPAKAATFPLKMSVEFQVAKVSGSEVGYAARSPTISITSGTAKYRVKGLFFYVNDKMLDSATVYRNINAVVCPGTPLALAPVGNAQLLVMNTTKTTDKFALQFTSIEKAESTATCGTGTNVVVPVDEAPANVTYAMLVGNDSKVNVFKTQCLSCHSGAGADGGLDLSNYAASKAKSAAIIRRINDANAPMPRSGLMSSSMKAIVQKWVDLQMPQ